MDELRASARGAFAEITALQQTHNIPARRGIDGHAGAGRTAADHDEVPWPTLCFESREHASSGHLLRPLLSYNRCSALPMPVTLRVPIFAAEPRDEPRPAPELFSQEQLEAHAQSLAAEQRLAPDPSRGHSLAPRLDKCGEVLENAYQVLSAADPSGARPVGSEDWLRDTFHVVQDQIRAIRQDLPRKYYLE